MADFARHVGAIYLMLQILIEWIYLKAADLCENRYSQHIEEHDIDAVRVPISEADVARLLEAVGVHCRHIQGFFGLEEPCDNLDDSVVAPPYFTSAGLDPVNTVAVSLDAGGVYRSKQFREGLKAGLAI